MDSQAFLKSCPVKMKSITSFFKPSSFKETRKSEKNDDQDFTVQEQQGIAETNQDVEMSYEDFVRESSARTRKSEIDPKEILTPEEPLNKTLEGMTETKEFLATDQPSNKRNEEVTYQDFLKTCKTEKNDQSEACVNSNMKTEDNSDCIDRNITNSKLKAVISESNGQTALVVDNNENPCSSIKLSQSEPGASQPATGKASILNYFHKSSKDIANKKKIPDTEVVITKVEVMIHSEFQQKPPPNNKPKTKPPKRMFDIFDAKKRKCGLVSNVCLPSKDVDMSITVIETVGSESCVEAESNLSEDDKNIQSDLVEPKTKEVRSKNNNKEPVSKKVESVEPKSKEVKNKNNNKEPVSKKKGISSKGKITFVH